MPRSVVEHRCLIISPSDVTEERAAVVDVIHRWNASVGANWGIRVEPMLWETHTHPDFSGPPQAKINEQIVDECDFGIAIFWSRVGTPTAEHDSGSVEEVERLYGRGAKVLLYRSSRPIPPDKIDTKQYDRLKKLMQQFQKRGLLGQFTDINELRERVNKDLSLVLRGESIEKAGITADVETVQRPDIRVKTSNIVAFPAEERMSFLRITVENHSPRKFFLSSVTMRLSDGQGLWPQLDALTNIPNAPQIIETGDSYSFHISPDVFKKTDVASVVCAEAHDKIGRLFKSDAEETRRAIDSMMKDWKDVHKKA